MSEFYEARIRAEWPDWTFGAHQAAARAAAAEQLVALRRRYRDLAEEEVAALAETWRPDSASGPYFGFAAAADHGGEQEHNGGEPGLVAVSATFVKALLRELQDQAPAALAALLDRWAEQRAQALHAGTRPVHAAVPRVAVLLPRDETRWPAESWPGLSALDLEAPEFDGAVLRWDAKSALWLALPRG